MSYRKTFLYRVWNVAAHDDEGRGVDLKLAVEQTGGRGYAAYACWDRKPEDQDEVVVASTEYASSGAEAYCNLRSKLESDRGLTLETYSPPDWLLTREWEELPGEGPPLP